MSSQHSTSFIHIPASILSRLNLLELFTREQPLEIELGAGDGSFLAKYAALHPEHNFIGVERLLGRLRKIDRKAGRAALQNLRLLRMEAAYFMEFLIPPQSADVLHIYFPDPWPKRKHRKNRLINESFTQIAANVLKDHGYVYLRTDDQDYFQQMITVFGANSQFALVETPEDLQNVLTDFERGFQRMGKGTLRAAYRKKNK